MAEDKLVDNPVPWSSRKFWTMMVWQSVWTGLLAGGILTQDNYFLLSLIGVGGYLAANIVGKFAEKR